MNPDDLTAWAAAWEAEHGRPFGSPEEVAHHLRERDQAAGLSQLMGRPLDEHDWRYLWFNGYTPENIESGAGPDWGRWGHYGGPSPYKTAYDYLMSRRNRNYASSDFRSRPGRRVPGPYPPY